MQKNWHGDDRYFGVHYDLHANEHDTELGTRSNPAHLGKMFRLMGADFLQTDCKGHPGFTSWFSKTPGASVSPGVKKDMMAQWRKATKNLGLPLHCHYSGIWDAAFGAKHPEWCVHKPDGEVAGAPFGQNAGAATPETLCPRSPYADTLLIPHFIELVDRYKVDGFWIDGDMWAVRPCYCATCKSAWTEETGLAEAPADVADSLWPRWMQFTRRGFEAYVTKYCDAVHRRKPGVLVCSNWLQTFKNPGEPSVPTDWISGDNAWIWGMDGSRCEARFLANRGKPWDIMLWNFYCVHGMGKKESPWVVKPAEMLQQEAAVILASGGNVQVYEHPDSRDGQFMEWRSERIGETARFAKARRRVCQNTQTIPQIAVLHSETHLYSNYKGGNLMWDVDANPVRGAVFALLENHWSVDILDEWALRGTGEFYPVIVVPEQHDMSGEMVEWLKLYVRGGGKLLLSGAKLAERFGAEFTGITQSEAPAAKMLTLPVSGGRVPLWDAEWGLYECSTARSFGVLGETTHMTERLTKYPALAINRAGRGKVGVIPGAIFRDFEHNRYGMVRAFAGEAVRRLAGRFDTEVKAPVCADVTLRRKGKNIYIHLVNRSSGIPNVPNAGEIDEIPEVGPVVITVKLPPGKYGARRCFERGSVSTLPRKTKKGVVLKITLDRFRIHEAVEIKSFDGELHVK